MPKAGLFAGEVTGSAPADGASTLKQKGYHWMQYGEAPPDPCNEIWDIAVLTPDLHVGGEVAGVWDGDLIIGTGALDDDRLDEVWATNDSDEYTQYTGSVVPEVYYPDCQWYLYSIIQ